MRAVLRSSAVFNVGVSGGRVERDDGERRLVVAAATVHSHGRPSAAAAAERRVRIEAADHRDRCSEKQEAGAQFKGKKIAPKIAPKIASIFIF